VKSTLLQPKTDGSWTWAPDAGGFDAFYAVTASKLVGELYLMCGNWAEAEDCLQEAYMRAWARWPSVSTYSRPDAWLRTVAWRVAIGRWRRVQSAARAWERLRAAGDPIVELEPEDMSVLRVIQRLPFKQREALVLHDVAGFSVVDIAERFNIPIGTVKARLSRGRARLRQLFDEEHL